MVVPIRHLDSLELYDGGDGVLKSAPFLGEADGTRSQRHRYDPRSPEIYADSAVIRRSKVVWRGAGMDLSMRTKSDKRVAWREKCRE